MVGGCAGFRCLLGCCGVMLMWLAGSCMLALVLVTLFCGFGFPGDLVLGLCSGLVCCVFCVVWTCGGLGFKFGGGFALTG